MSAAFNSSIVYRLFFLAALFLHPARAEIYVRGSPAGIVVGIIFLLCLVGCCVAGCFFVARRRKARQPPAMFKPLAPLPQDQVPMLAPPASQGSFSDAAAPPYTQQAQSIGGGGYGQNMAYPQNPQNTAAYNDPYHPAAASRSSVTLSAYSQDSHMQAPAGSNNQNPFSPPPGPPPVVTV
ncbi:hypothetical protein C8R44DRAFT_866509 [Mycena epipterygia]|nr:hypothetical protein C8R44DRAFT_866509 [Mycena epipterygia]